MTPSLAVTGRERALLCIIGLVLFSLSMAAAAAETVAVLLRGGQGDIAEAVIKDGRVVIGRVGDVVLLDRGANEFVVSGPRGYALRATLNVSGASLVVENSAVVEPLCSDRFETDWPAPTLVKQKWSRRASIPPRVRIVVASIDQRRGRR